MRRYCCPRTYFYPRPPRGGRLGVIGQYGHRLIFLSTPSARRATTTFSTAPDSSMNFYPRPPRGGRRLCAALPVHERAISIHALREEGDPPVLPVWMTAQSISIHALREEGDPATSASPCSSKNFYPRPPRGGRLRIDGDNAVLRKFLSTPSARRATLFGVLSPALSRNFYPRPPRGGRLRPLPALWFSVLFLSTPSARRATVVIDDLGNQVTDFYPRPPRGGRQQKQRQNLYFQTNYTTFCTNLEEP